ncbi:DNA-binding transcriptional regulator, CsgD family [Tranquillimonas rosea]|uniref:DNA-binding transcriptional regulator, CsgD family n=1 Tax=Tranquillimonas rosea TaxID=641238 RepID=A0A1H9S6B9_9RHOB|nr:helix-turn-helix transcriptional regulator [Tranquillimonas rosea]SER80582.1 DNA-binding transcriptional regulator, CsgD family [Tranquillimonas rosea]
MDLDDAVLDRLTDIQRRFLSVSLEQAGIEALLADIGQLVGADAAFAAWLDEGQPWLTPWKAGPEIGTFLAETFAGVDVEGNIRCHDPDLDALNRTRRALGSGVYNEGALASRERITDTAYFRDAFEPAGMPQIVGMTTRLSVGEAIFAFGFQAPDAPGFVSGRTEAILRILLPSFEAGFLAIDRRNRHRERLEQAVRECPVPARISGPDDPPDPGHLLQLPLPELGEDRAGRMSHLLVGRPGPADLARQLAITFGLTPRQTEATALLLEGRSTRAIADRLGVTYNTARRHCEAILQKTEAQRREQLASIAVAALGNGDAPRGP